MSKKLIIMIAAVGLVSFAGTFIFAWLTKAAPQEQITEDEQAALSIREVELKLPPPLESPQTEMVTTSSVGTVDSKAKKTMTEKQLKTLVYDVREKIQEYNAKLQELGAREQRLQVVQDTLKKDIEELNNLRIELASIVASLKSERDKLLKSRIEIAEAEKSNLIAIAAAYDKMDSVGAGKILVSMSQAQDDSADDAVKILHYMTERTKAKLLAELANSEPKLAAAFCQRLKQIFEGK